MKNSKISALLLICNPIYALKRNRFATTYYRAHPHFQNLIPSYKMTDKSIEESAIELIPDSMKSLLIERINDGLADWSTSNCCDGETNESVKEKASVKVYDTFLKWHINVVNSESNLSISQIRRRLDEEGLKLNRALISRPRDIYQLLRGDTDNLLKEMMAEYDKDREANKIIFQNITHHHKRLLGEVWDEAKTNRTALESYATAATAMGEKRWVRQGHDWMENQIISFFQQGGAKKAYLKGARTAFFERHQIPMPKEEYERLSSLLADDLTLLSERSSDSFDKGVDYSFISKAGEDITGSNRRAIRLLDVGSCYNHFASCKIASQLEVTALDLCPAPGANSVFQCDFLELVVGDSGSPFKVTSSTADGTLTTTGDTVDEQSKKKIRDTAPREPVVIGERDSISSSRNVSDQQSYRKLLQLPAEYFDVVTISLVLSYLPLESMRRKMIRQARRLLVSPPATSLDLTSTRDGEDSSRHSEGGSGCQRSGCKPHYSGLLLIIEKESIFKARVANDNLSRNWVTAIENLGFSLIRYQLLASDVDGRKAHAFCFRVIPCTSTLSSEILQSEENVLDPQFQMLIRREEKV